MRNTTIKYSFVVMLILVLALVVGCSKSYDNSMKDGGGYYDYAEEEAAYEMIDDAGGYGGYAGKDSLKRSDKAPSPSITDTLSDTGYVGDLDYDSSTEETFEVPVTGTTPTDTDGESGKSGESDGEREPLMIIKTADLTFEGKDVDRTGNEVLEIASKYDGIIANSEKYKDDYGSNFATIVIRVRPENFEKIIAEFKAMEGLDLLNEQISGSDITREYVDLKARLKNKREVQVRYFKLLERGGRVPDILTVEREIERVGEDIERLEGQIRYYENQVSLSTITVILSEPVGTLPGERSFSDAMKDAFRMMIDVIVFMIQTLIVLMPFIFLVILLMFVVWAINRVRKARKLEKL